MEVFEGLGTFAKTIHPYPTRAEAIRKLGDQYNRTRLSPWVKRLFEAWTTEFQPSDRGHHVEPSA